MEATAAACKLLIRQPCTPLLHVSCHPRSQGIQAEVRTYNTVISACNKSGQPEQALQVYERMLAAGIKPSATTYTALISAYGRAGQVEKALEIFQDMIRRGCERNVITYSSLISACEKVRGLWEGFWRHRCSTLGLAHVTCSFFAHVALL